MFIHDIIKLNYISLGYLPGYPYYLISDEEMFNAFLKDGGFFNDFYPCPSDGLQEAYDTLHKFISDTINSFIKGDTSSLPDWIYSYMIMRPITFDSSEQDISYLNDMAGISQKGAPQFTEESADACYETSIKWLQKQPSKYSKRPPTMFGETHVTKSLRLDQSNILTNDTGEF